MNKFTLVFQKLRHGKWSDMAEITQYFMGTLAQYVIEIENGYRPIAPLNCTREDAAKVTRLRTISQIF